MLSILEEEPEVEEIPETAENRKKAKAVHPFGGAAADHVTFAYQDEKILEDYSVRLEPGKITGISRSQRLRKVYAAQAIDAFLGCGSGES